MPEPTACLDPETLAAYLDGLLAEDAIHRADRHIDHCGSCRSELSALAATHSFPTGSGAFGLVDGIVLEGRLGRYEVLRELGRGSMGVVVRAYDPELARAVAVKILEARFGERVRTEAQAMARLAHPNVVGVYDVVPHGDSICIAMELVEGTTLREHVRGKPWRAVLAACIAAGRGLAAAHAAKLVHRDYKPENVLCAGDRVVVSDFGLARADGSAADALLAGTPAYMAPELFRGEPATAASDQFSFCVATYEALYGERPFAGDSLTALRASTTAGVPRPPPAGMHVPPWLRALLVRGLAPDPQRRYGSLAELLDRLEARRRRHPARRWLALAASAIVAVTLAVALTRSTAPSCDLDPGYDAAALDVALAARGTDTVARVDAAFAAYARDWQTARAAACTRGADTACLERARDQLDELAASVAREPQLADRAVEAVYRLPEPAACDGDTQSADPLRAGVDRASTMLATGKAAEAIAAITELLPAVRDPRTHAEALLVRGRAEQALGNLEASETTLADALTHAERAHADPVVAAIWVELVQTTGAQKHRFEAALANMRAADAAFTRRDPGPVVRARYAYVVGTTLLAQGKLAEARAQLEPALEITSGGEAGARPGERGLVHSALCDVLRQSHELAAARAHCRAALAELATAFGPDHPRLAPTYNVAGALELDAGAPGAARASFAHTIAILESHHLEGERALALALSNTAAAYMREGDAAHARPLFERARVLFAQHHPDHPQRVLPLQGLASLALETGDYATAVQTYEEARGVIEAVYGIDSDQRRVVVYNLALAYQRLPDAERATALCEELVAAAQRPGREAWPIAALALELEATIADARRDPPHAIELRERALAALDHDDRPAQRAYLEMSLGTALRRRQPARARTLLEHAVAYFDHDNSDRYYAGSARFSLARALWDAGDRRRAIALAETARSDFATAQLGLNLAGKRAEVAAWLASHN